MKGKIKKLAFIFLVIVLLIVLIFLCSFIYTTFTNKLHLEDNIEDALSKNSEKLFTIDKVVFFSSCNSSSTINTNATTTINNLSQYTDIALFINSEITDFSLSNSLKSLSIRDISFVTNPSVGTPSLYYKSLSNFATPEIDKNNIINSNFDFSISSDNEIDFSKPILFNNCANPIVLSYVNNNIKDDYTIDSLDNSLTHDGSLLKKCNIPLSDLKCSLSFTIYIENNLGDSFKCPVYIDIPLEDENYSIYDGAYSKTFSTNYNFFAY